MNPTKKVSYLLKGVMCNPGEDLDDKGIQAIIASLKEHVLHINEDMREMMAKRFTMKVAINPMKSSLAINPMKSSPARANASLDVNGHPLRHSHAYIFPEGLAVKAYL